LACTRAIPMTVAAAGAAGVQLAMGAAVVGALLLGLPALADGTISAPLYVGLLLAIMASFEPTLVLVRAIGKLAVAGAAAERLDRIATREPAIAEPLHAAPLTAGSTIAYHDIGFSYPESRRVLDHLDLAIPAGSRIAIVGESGSGKSTLLKLLLRLADPQQGRVTIASADIRTVPLAALHARVALLSQDAPVFHDTIRNNLLVGRPDATDADLWAALEAGQLADVVRALPKGLDAVVGETGRTLSAGQARRLCLARTLLSGAEILAFDEPTSGLDPENEQAFFAALAKAAPGRSLLIVTHAALPPDIVDRTYRMNEGALTLVE
jgi:ATP-binding cassette subfamily C protein CydC